MSGACREKTIEERILDLASPERAHDYEAESKKIIDMIDERNAMQYREYTRHVRELERKIEVLQTIIDCMAESVMRKRD